MTSMLMTMVNNTEAGLVDVIDEAEEEEGGNHDDNGTPSTQTTTATTTAVNGSSSLLSSSSSSVGSSSTERAVVVTNGLEVLTDKSLALLEQNGNGMTHHHHRNDQAPLSAWLMPELAKVAETLQLLRSRLPSTVTQGWQLDDAICNALEATRRVADHYGDDSSSPLTGNSNDLLIPASVVNASTESQDDSSDSAVDSSSSSSSNHNNHNHILSNGGGGIIAEFDNNPNSEYQTLSRYALNGRPSKNNDDDHADYQKIALMNGLAPPESSHYESAVTPLSDEDEYDRLAYEFPIHPSMRNRSGGHPRPPPPPNEDDDDDDSAPMQHLNNHHNGHNGHITPIVLPPRPVLVDAAVGRSSGSVMTNEKGCNTYRVLNVSRPVQATEVPPAKFSKHVQTHVLVTDKCVGWSDDDDDLLPSRVDAEIQTDEVHVQSPRLTEDSWGQTEDKFTENVSVHANMLRDFGQTVSTQTLMGHDAHAYVSSPPPMHHSAVPHSPRSLTPTHAASASVGSSSSASHHNSRRLTTTSTGSATSSLRSPTSSTPASTTTSNGCYQLFVRIDQNGAGSTANMLPGPGAVANNNNSNNNHKNHALNSNGHSTRMLSSSSSSSEAAPSSSSGGFDGQTILSPSDGVITQTSAFMASAIVSSTMSPPTSDSQTIATNDQSLSSDDRSSSPRSWQSPIQITGPTDPSPVLGMPANIPAPPPPPPPPARMRRASMNTQAQPFRSGALAAATGNHPASYKSLIKISEGSPPEIRHTKQATTENSKSTLLVHQHPKTITKIIHRLQRDPSIRAWCSVDNLLRQNISISREDLDNVDGKATPVALERAISPPTLFREFGEINTQPPHKEMAVDCAHVSVAERRNRFAVAAELMAAKSLKLSLHDVSHAAAQQGLRGESHHHPQKISSKHKSQIHLHQQLQRDNVVCLGRRTLVSVGSEDSDFSVCETLYDKPRGYLRGNNSNNSSASSNNNNNNNNNNNKHRRSNYPAVASLAALNGRSTDFEKMAPGASPSSSNLGSASSSGTGNSGNSVLNKISNFLHFGNSKQKRMPLQC